MIGMERELTGGWGRWRSDDSMEMGQMGVGSIV